MVLNYVPFFERENMEEFLQVGVISSTHGIARGGQSISYHG